MRFDVEHEGRKTISVSHDEALELNYPQAVVDVAMAKARAKLIGKECRRRIYDLASAETQMNMSAAAAVISAKSASARTEQEKAILVGLEAAIDWVAAMRGNVAVLAADANADFLADESWPVASRSASAIANQF